MDVSASIKRDQKNRNYNKKLKSVLEFFDKLSKQTYLSVIRDSFTLLLPLIIAGAFASFFTTVIVGTTNISLAYWIASWSKQYVLGVNGFQFIGIGKHIIDGLQTTGQVVYNAIFLCFSAYVAFLIGYLLAKIRIPELAIMTGILTLGCFFISGGITIYWDDFTKISIKFLGVDGLFPAGIIAITAAELFLWITKNHHPVIRKLNTDNKVFNYSIFNFFAFIVIILVFLIISHCSLTLPIEKTIIKDFNQLFDLTSNQNTIKAIVKNEQGTIFYAIFTRINDQKSWTRMVTTLSNEQLVTLNKVKYLTFSNQIYELWGNYQPEFGNYAFFTTDINPLNLITAIYKIFTMPLILLRTKIANNLGSALIYVLFVQLFWFFGFYGTNITNSIFGPLWIHALTQNKSAFLNGASVQNIFNESFFTGFIFLGGGGMSLALVIITLLIGRHHRARLVSKISLVLVVFNIHQPVNYGYHLKLNWILAIPAIFGPVILVFWTWLWMVFGYVPYPTIKIASIAPVGIGAMLATLSWQGLLLACSNLIIAILIYWPFILLSNRLAKLNHEAVPLNYLGKIHYFLTGRNFQDLKYQELKQQHRSEKKLLAANHSSIKERNRLQLKHAQEWVLYQQLAKEDQKNAVIKKKAAKKMRRQQELQLQKECAQNYKNLKKNKDRLKKQKGALKIAQKLVKQAKKKVNRNLPSQFT